MKEQWDNRYASDQYIYGYQPNEFLSSQLSKIKPGKILLPGDGEGRNAVFAAKLGWKTFAFDYSVTAKEKALSLATKEKVNIHYFNSDVEEFETIEKFDVIAVIYFHLPEKTRLSFHKKLKQFLKPNGMVILECFSKNQLQNNSGGPKNLDLLYSLEDISHDFSDYKIEYLSELKVELNEGILHQGLAEVIRLIARNN